MFRFGFLVLLLTVNNWIPVVNAQDVCTLCYGGGSPGKPDAYVDDTGFTCADLAETAAGFTTDEDQCTQLQSHGWASCGCPQHAAFPECAICGGLSPGNPDTTIMTQAGNFTCAELAVGGSLVPDSLCPLLQSYANETCGCPLFESGAVTYLAPTTPTPVILSTPAPVTPAPVVPPTPAPVIPSTPAPVTPAPVIPSTLAPVTSAPVIPPTPAPATPAPVIPSTLAPVNPVTLAAVVPTRPPTLSPTPPLSPVPSSAPSVEPPYPLRKKDATPTVKDDSAVAPPTFGGGARNDG